MDKGAMCYLRFTDGDKSGFTELVREYKEGLVIFLASFMGDYHLAEDAADEAFLRLYVKKPRYNSRYSFKTWLYTIGKNTGRNILKKQSRNTAVPTEEHLYITDTIDIESDYIKDEEKRQLHRAVRGLKEDYAQVLLLVYFEGFTNSEAAVIMGKSNRQISDLIYRAKAALKTELDKEFGKEGGYGYF